MKKILVTGAGGFIGSHVVESLLLRGEKVRALFHYNGAGRRGHLDNLRARRPKNLEIHAGDVTDVFQMHKLIEGCSHVLHLAALIGIPYSYEAAAAYVATNIYGTLNILEACRRHGVQRVIITSTSEVYGTAQRIPMDETHPLNAQSPYAATKIAADQLALSYHRSHGLPVVLLRPFNTYGPRQSARAVLPTILAQILAGQSIVRVGNLAPQRDLTFVTDTAKAFIAALQQPGLDGQTIHFGQGVAVSVRDLVQRSLVVLNRRARVVSIQARNRPPNSEVGLLLCDASRARTNLGWNPEVSLETGIQRTAAYIKEHLHDYWPGEYTK